MRAIYLPLTGLAFGLMASSIALAADLPSRRVAPVVVPPPLPTFTWTGFYVGGNAGYAFDERRTNNFAFSNGSVQDVTPFGTQPGGEDGVLSVLSGGRKNGFTGGGQIGYNYQFSNGLGIFNGLGGGSGGVVVGIEADAQYLGLGRNNGASNYTFTPTNGNVFNNGTAFVPNAGNAAPTVIVHPRRIDYFGTVRGRLGYGFDRFLAYGTGGIAYSDNRVGYAVGGGLEYAVTNHVTIRGEYLYVNLDRGNGANTAVYNQAANTFTTSPTGGRESFNVVRAALNYKFDFAAPTVPVVARY